MIASVIPPAASAHHGARPLPPPKITQSTPSLPPPTPTPPRLHAVVEADRLQHELTATRDKMRTMEQRAALLERERSGAALQLEAELNAARSKIEAIESRRRRRGGGGGGGGGGRRRSG